MITSSVCAGIVQLDVKLGDSSTNLKNVLVGLQRLADQGVNLAVLPEMWASGFDHRNLRKHSPETPRILDALADKAVQYNMVIAGSLAEELNPPAEKNYNSLYVIDAQGEIVGKYRKIHLFSPTHEEEFFLPGKAQMVCPTRLGRLGLMICYDLRFPELCRNLALQGAEVVLICAQWPAIRIQHWEILVQARAIENQLFVVAANRCGRDSKLAYGGRSLIVSPLGNILASAGEDPVCPSAWLNMEELREFRKALPCLQARHPEIYSSLPSGKSLL